MFANIYLNEVDQYIKHKLKIKYYCRYLDDSIVIVKTKKEAKETLEKIKIFLRNNLELELNSKTQIFKNKQGVNFCGYKINEYRMKIRDKGKRKLKKENKELIIILGVPEVSYEIDYFLDNFDIDYVVNLPTGGVVVAAVC